MDTNWHVQDNTDEPLGQLRVDSNEGCVCVVGTNTHDWTVDNERRRMARLIAAAPEMLDTLKRIARKQETGEGDFSVAELCRAIVAKSEGGE